MLRLRHIAILLSVLFLFAQGLAFAHTAEFGDHHDHDGVACSVTILGQDETVLPSPVEVDIAPVEEIPAPALYPTHTVRFSSAPSGRAPPPRAPPH